MDRNITNELLTALKTVALRKESVDRNSSDVVSVQYRCKSLSARRAWIEIFGCAGHQVHAAGRSPQGERG